MKFLHPKGEYVIFALTDHLTPQKLGRKNKDIQEDQGMNVGRFNLEFPFKTLN